MVWHHHYEISPFVLCTCKCTDCTHRNSCLWFSAPEKVKLRKDGDLSYFYKPQEEEVCEQIMHILSKRCYCYNDVIIASLREGVQHPALYLDMFFSVLIFVSVFLKPVWRVSWKDLFLVCGTIITVRIM